jgi:hypothetical protein
LPLVCREVRASGIRKGALLTEGFKQYFEVHLSVLFIKKGFSDYSTSVNKSSLNVQDSGSS